MKKLIGIQNTTLGVFFIGLLLTFAQFVNIIIPLKMMECIMTISLASLYMWCVSMDLNRPSRPLIPTLIAMVFTYLMLPVLIPSLEPIFVKYTMQYTHVYIRQFIASVSGLIVIIINAFCYEILLLLANPKRRAFVLE